MDKVIITAAVNGNRTEKPGGPAIPATPQEIAEDARRCHQAGATVVHFHARDPQTRFSTADKAVFAETIARIRRNGDMLVETSTGLGPRIDPVTRRPLIDPDTRSTVKPSEAERLTLLEIDPPQDLGAIAMGSMNMFNPVYPEAVVFINSDHYITESLRRLSAQPRIGFQFEIFDLGFLFSVDRLVRRGLLDRQNPRFWLNYILGFGGLPPEPRFLELIRDEGKRLFPDALWGGLAPAQEHWTIQQAAADLGADVMRTGLEDTIHLPDGTVTDTNAQLVEALVALVRRSGREPATPAEARVMLGLA
ncbi:BKACE family enzyme [Paracoccus yeei]|uniref:3-keto-5-aminohexanoate cleavage protein n=1 Tax=Paracoccus yeei TaxID=147645 RepID=A0A5P2QTT6_9RHOB|nr:3-keto-5-aminohexanoate cleavage protein [Paracoccus yeei]QEU09501.1 3-keto-5-aminohexanoate cleavage protein [Paracoccus yeei]